MENDNNHEIITVKLNKWSAWQALKLLLFMFASAFIISILSHSFVGFNNWLGKGIGLVQPFIQYCADCLRAIGG